MDRRAFLTVATSLTVSAAVGPRELTMWQGSPLSYAESWLRGLREAHWRGESAPAIYRGLLRHAYDVERETAFLADRVLQQNLYSVQAQALCLAGSIAFLDLGERQRAERHLLAGVRAATRSSDSRLISWVCAKLAQHRLYDPSGSVTLLHEALQYCARGERQAQGNPVVIANVLRMEAEVYAKLGLASPMLRSLERAEDLLASADQEETPSWHANLTADKLHGMAGACWLRLGDAQRSAEAFQSMQYDKVEDHAHSVVTVADTARAYALLGEPEHAVTLLSLVIPTASITNSLVRRARIRDARTALAPWRREPFVRELDEQLADAGIA